MIRVPRIMVKGFTFCILKLAIIQTQNNYDHEFFKRTLNLLIPIILPAKTFLYFDKPVLLKFNL